MHICLFDIDGTLLNTGGAGQAAMEAAFHSEFATEKPIHGIPAAGRTDRAIVGDLFRYFDLPADAQAFARLHQAYLRHLPEALNSCVGTVLPGIFELMDALSARDDVLLGLLTGNFEHGAELKLRHYKLQHHFQFGGFGDRHLHREDVAREALAAAQARLNGQLRLDRLWVIGDTPSDIRCARAIGAVAVAVETGIFTPDALRAEQPNHQLPNLADYAAFLRLLE